VLTFLAKVGLISLTGALAPGPITAFAAARGSQTPHAGALVVLGHMAVESVVLVLVLAFLGVDRVVQRAGVQAGIGLAGAVVLLLMGIGMLRAMTPGRPAASTDGAVEGGTEAPSGAPAARACVLAGVSLSASSPYFLVWWATVGAALAFEARAFGALGVALFVALHWLVDLGWCYFVSWAAFRGQRAFGERFQRGILGVCGAFLVLMAAKFAYDGSRILLS
jgi:threonine/homoserine/homoserine lactone efflux protein